MTAPTDPLDRLEWVVARREHLARIERKALFDARIQGRLEQAREIVGLSNKRAVALTRQENDQRGRMVRWSRHG